MVIVTIQSFKLNICLILSFQFKFPFFFFLMSNHLSGQQCQCSVIVNPNCGQHFLRDIGWLLCYRKLLYR